MQSDSLFLPAYVLSTSIAILGTVGFGIYRLPAYNAGFPDTGFEDGSFQRWVVGENSLTKPFTN